MNENINDQVASLLLDASTREPRGSSTEFDILEMPLEGVAAFWLSVKKTMDAKKLPEQYLAEEARHTKEPYIKFLLELAASSFSPERCEQLATVRKNNILVALQRKYVLMAIGLLGIVSNENPQKVMIRFLSKFHIAPIFEKQVFEVAQVILKNLDNADLNKAKFLNIDHKLKIEALLITLVFYCMLARRSGAQKVLQYEEFITSAYFKDGLHLICDGFDYDFIKYRLNLVKKEILTDTETKMDLSIGMMRALKSHAPFTDLYLVAKAYLP